MGYIRSDEDYYVSTGMSPERASQQVELDKHNIDYGYCNPQKAKSAAEQEREILKKLEEKKSE